MKEKGKEKTAKGSRGKGKGMGLAEMGRGEWGLSKYFTPRSSAGENPDNIKSYMMHSI